MHRPGLGSSSLSLNIGTVGATCGGGYNYSAVATVTIIAPGPRGESTLGSVTCTVTREAPKLVAPRRSMAKAGE